MVRRGGAAYLALAGQSSADELAAAALLGAGAAACHVAVLRSGARRFRFDRDAARTAARAVIRFPAATARAGSALAGSVVAPRPGRIVARPFHAGRRDVPEEAGCRAAVVLATSLAPDSYVLRLSSAEDAVPVPCRRGGPAGRRSALARLSAAVSPWLAAILALLPPLLVPLAAAWRGRAGQRFVAVQLAGSVGTVMLVLMSFAFDQASSIGLAVTFGALTAPASFLYALVLERWL